MVNTIIKLTIVVDFILPVLISTPGRKSNGFLLILKRCRIFKKPMDDQRSFHTFILFLIKVRYRRIKRCQNHRFFRLIPHSLINGVQVQLSKAIPRLFIQVNLLRSNWLLGVVINELPFYDILLLLVEDLTVVFRELHPRMFQNLCDIDSFIWICLQHGP
jgi:hypothetical protein